MSELVEQRCEACRKGAPYATEEEIDEFLPQIPEWSIVDVGGLKRLKRAFKFGNFADALAFTMKIGELAESERHHPALTTEWGKVTVTWFTKKIKGLHRNDFIMAAKTDRVYASQFYSSTAT